MVKLIRIATFVGAFLFILASLFIVDAKKELDFAHMAYRHNDMDQAMCHARKALWATGDDKNIRFDALALKAKIAFLLKRQKYAEKYLGELINIKPGPSCFSCYLTRGELRYKAGDYKGALDDFNAGLKPENRLSPRWASYYYSRRGQTLLVLGKKSNALKDAKTAISLDYDGPLGHFFKSTILDKKGDIKGAFKEAEIAYQLAITKRKRFFVPRNTYMPVIIEDFMSQEGKKWFGYYMNIQYRYKKSLRKK